MNEEQKYNIQGMERFFRSMLLGEKHDLRNRIMHVDWGKVDSRDENQSATAVVQSANLALSLPSRCKDCTLEEVAVLRVVQMNPTATQKELAKEIRKSERTVKTLTVTLQVKGILHRVGGKRDGRWQIESD